MAKPDQSSQTPEEYLQQLNERSAAYGGTPSSTTNSTYSTTTSGYEPQTPAVPQQTKSAGNYVRAAFSVIAFLVVAGVLFSTLKNVGYKISTPLSGGGSSNAAEARVSAANKVLDGIAVAPDWQISGTRKKDILGKGDDASATVEETYSVPANYGRAELEAWFAKQTMVAKNLSDARCDFTLDKSYISCSVTLYAKGPDGERDFHKPRNRLSVVLQDSQHEPNPTISVSAQSSP